MICILSFAFPKEGSYHSADNHCSGATGVSFTHNKWSLIHFSISLFYFKWSLFIFSPFNFFTFTFLSNFPCFLFHRCSQWSLILFSDSLFIFPNCLFHFNWSLVLFSISTAPSLTLKLSLCSFSFYSQQVVPNSLFPVLLFNFHFFISFLLFSLSFQKLPEKLPCECFKPSELIIKHLRGSFSLFLLCLLYYSSVFLSSLF